MRTIRSLRAPRALHAVAGALVLAVPGGALAFASGASNALGATQAPALHASVSRHSVRYGTAVTVHGTAPAGDAGRTVELQFQTGGTSAWRSVAKTSVGSTEHFSFHLVLRRSGRLRVISPAAPLSASDPAAGAAGATSTQPSPSDPQQVGVTAALRVRQRSMNVATGRGISVRGHLLPNQGGRRVRLITRTSRGWITLARTRTSRSGDFNLRYRLGTPGTRWLRVSFAGDRANRGTWTRAGRVTGLVPRVASWYNDGGNTACGFHAHYGVANRSLPCGTRVMFVSGGRSVVATVDDRGPYVGGRDYDFNQNVARALGMYGVATVLASR